MYNPLYTKAYTCTKWPNLIIYMDAVLILHLSININNSMITSCISFNIHYLDTFRCCLCTLWHIGTGRRRACWRRPGCRRCTCACRLRTRPCPGHNGRQASQWEDRTHNPSLGHTWQHPRHSCTRWHSLTPSGTRHILRENNNKCKLLLLMC